ncbi:MAG: DNA-directed RNA polymerase subunit alpha [Pseudobdellovibrionaceae bacterium]|uniref:DNA-directed RNA polymerase subunit alpha n=1 Tax=Oligoflexus sp. TaxID=1971216 RepID=UPI0027CCDBA3|nr:DNA-directed RNA polymerase subunit alpha [Oligoflexus sp.]MDQ3233426.1 DNA-directed RNA polymerase subunit alpha [Pseudobdellovibrionaceae bacterium]HYX39205.1 DNA-directed RNA polymerase subunit alpha [Oligoflexus sp.]
MHRNWQDLITPNNVEIAALTDTYGKFIAKPLERGYGITLGNSLRRVLLSSINGAAIVAVRIEGVEHELSTITGVKEDVTDIILNLKQVNIRYLGENDARITLKSKGDGILRAGDIQASSDVEILNPEQHIATIGSDGSLSMEMIVRHGRGYVSADANRTETIPTGYIVTDSIFAPVRRVAYTVSNARVGQMTDYDKLTLEVWTNAAVRPDDALAYAAKILKEQLTIFINFDESEEVEARGSEETIEARPQLNENLFKTVDSLELSVRAANCLENANIKYIGELVTKTEAEMLKTKNFGRKSLNEIKDILAEMGLSLGMKIDGFDPSMLRQKESESN